MSTSSNNKTQTTSLASLQSVSPQKSPQIHSTSTSPSKMLTDFSIDTIIGLRDSAACLQHHKQPPGHELGLGGVARRPKATNTHLRPTSRVKTEIESPEGKAKTSAKKYRPKNFQCPACKMAFSNNGQLKNHVRIHTGERPFTCNQQDCNKSFTRNEELTRHKLIHTGVRPHVCQSCGKRFGRKDHLKKHVRTHERKRFKKKTFAALGSAVKQQQQPLPQPIMTSSSIQSMAPSFSDHIFMPHQPMLVTSTARITAPTDHMHQIPEFQRPIATTTTTSTADCFLPPAATGDLRLPGTAIRQHSPPITSAQLTALLSQQASLPIATTTSIAGGAIQQLAGEYWRKWYSLFGFYQQQQQQQQQTFAPVDKFFRKGNAR